MPKPPFESRTYQDIDTLINLVVPHFSLGFTFLNVSLPVLHTFEYFFQKVTF